MMTPAAITKQLRAIDRSLTALGQPSPGPKLFKSQPITPPLIAAIAADVLARYRAKILALSREADDGALPAG